MQVQSRMLPFREAAFGNQELAKDQLDLLSLIDKIQFAQLNVKLPQIAVVGEQSAGKSSTLESLTGIPFQRNAEACTRFPIEVRLRRAPKESITIRIIPDPKNPKNRTHEELKRLKRFGEKVDESITFDNLMSLAIEQITPINGPGDFAAGDKLVVEKRGPQLPLLTVVDLPGLVSNKNAQQSEDDIATINDVTDRYMRNPRTIILAVVGGNADYVQASVLTKTRKFDPTGARTIGVLTKPDLTHIIGLEDKFIALVSNKDYHNHFKLGWYVLMNPGPGELPSAQEHKEKEAAFFNSGKWASVPEEMRGASALMQKLSTQLLRHIGRYIPKLQREVRQVYHECEKDIASLGTGNETLEDMKAELVKLCSDSKELVLPAVHGTYINPDGIPFFPAGVDPICTPTQKLRARAVEQNKKFANELRSYGDKFRFGSPNNSEAHKTKESGMKKEDFVRNHVKKLLHQNTGKEFPGDNIPRLVFTLFQDNAENWSTLAQNHKDDIGNICNEFLGEVIDHVWPSRMRSPLRTEFLNAQMKPIFDNAQKVLDSLLDDLKSEVRPYDPEYESRLSTWREQTVVERPISEEEELLEKMLIYYELTAKTFIANVITQVVERYLLRGLLTIFDTVKIFKMQNDKVEAIAAEDMTTVDQRRALRIRKAAIEEALDLCNDLAMRKDLRSYRTDNPDNEEATCSDDDEEERDLRPTTFKRKPEETPKVDRLVTSNETSSAPRQPNGSRDDQRQATPTKFRAVSNSNTGLNADSNAETSVTGDGRTVSRRDTANRPVDKAKDYYAPVRDSSAPTDPPPPPPLSQRVMSSRLSTEEYSHSPSLPDLMSRQQYPQYEQRSGINGFQQNQTHFGHVEMNGNHSQFLDSNNPYLQSPSRSRPIRKALGLT